MTDFENELIHEYNMWKTYLREMRFNVVFTEEEYECACNLFHEISNLLNYLNIKVER